MRAHTDDNVIHPEGSVDPLRDIETIETELIYADLEQAERRLERVAEAGARRRQGGDRRGGVAARGHRGAAGRAGRSRTVPGARRRARRAAQPLAADRQAGAVRRQRRRGQRRGPAGDRRRTPRPIGAQAVAVSSRLEAELSELDDEEAADDARGPRRQRVRAGPRRRTAPSRCCDLIAFFTAGEDKPAQSWHLRDGLTAWHAAGEIHADIQKGFVRAEVIGWDALVDAGGYAGARDRGTLRLEGRDYVMRDGDVITVKFTP